MTANDSAGDPSVELRDDDPLNRLGELDETDPVAEARAKAELKSALLGRPKDPIRLGRYVLGKRIGAGGLGVVYEGEDPKLSRPVAIKLVRPRSTSADAVRRLAREARFIARLDHPRVVSIFDIGVCPAGPSWDPAATAGVYIVMERLDGDLAGWLGAERRSTDEILERFTAAGEGLAAAHATGLLHLDFKPSNVLLGPGGVVKVADFGIARNAAEKRDRSQDTARVLPPGSRRDTTQSSAVFGTPMFMAPEQILGERVGPAADFYSLGVLAYVLLEGRPPMDGEGGQMLRRILDSEPAPMTTKVPPVLESMIHRLLDKNPDQRLCRAQDVLDLLHQCKKPRGGDEPTAAVRRRKTPAADLNLAPVIPGVTPVVIEKISTTQAHDATTDIPGLQDLSQRKLHIPILVAGLGFAFGLLCVAFLWRNNTDVVLLQTHGAVVARPPDVAQMAAVEMAAVETAPALNPPTERAADFVMDSASEFDAKSALEFDVNSEGPAKSRPHSEVPTKSAADSGATTKSAPHSGAMPKSGVNSKPRTDSDTQGNSERPTNSIPASNSESSPAKKSDEPKAQSYQDMLSEASRQLKLPTIQNDRTNFGRWRSIYLSAVLAQNKPKERKAAEARLRSLLKELARR